MGRIPPADVTNCSYCSRGELDMLLTARACVKPPCAGCTEVVALGEVDAQEALRQVCERHHRAGRSSDAAQHVGPLLGGNGARFSGTRRRAPRRRCGRRTAWSTGPSSDAPPAPVASRTTGPHARGPPRPTGETRRAPHNGFTLRPRSGAPRAADAATCAASPAKGRREPPLSPAKAISSEAAREEIRTTLASTEMMCAPVALPEGQRREWEDWEYSWMTMMPLGFVLYGIAYYNAPTTRSTSGRARARSSGWRTEFVGRPATTTTRNVTHARRCIFLTTLHHHA